jgi:hypothetical protein
MKVTCVFEEAGVTGSYEMSIITYKTTWLCNSEDKNLNFRQYENLESDLEFIYIVFWFINLFQIKKIQLNFRFNWIFWIWICQELNIATSAAAPRGRVHEQLRLENITCRDLNFNQH